jgi:hypothetical protein
MTASKSFYFERDGVEYLAETVLTCEEEYDGYLRISLESVEFFEAETEDEVEATEELYDILEEKVESNYNSLKKLFTEYDK